MTDFYIEMKLSEFVLRYPQIAYSPEVFPVVALLMSENSDNQYLVRLKDNRLEFGYGEDSWNIA